MKGVFLAKMKNNKSIKDRIQEIGWLARKLTSFFNTSRPIIFEEPRLRPVSYLFGFDRGTPIDRYYNEKFLREYSEYITGDVLEVADDTYTKKFGKNYRSHILHVDPSFSEATIAGDLSKPDSLPENLVDCFICNNTFHCIYDLKEAVRGAHKIINGGGVLLATLNGLCQTSPNDKISWGDYWRFTVMLAERLFSEYFSEVKVKSYGNVFSVKAFLDGIAVEDINDTSLLDFTDIDYPLTIGVFARK